MKNAVFASRFLSVPDGLIQIILLYLSDVRKKKKKIFNTAVCADPCTTRFGL